MSEREHAVHEMARYAAEAGASGAFVAAVVAEVDGRHIAREVAGRLARRGSTAERPAMGGFTSHLWDGDTAGAWRRADSQSRRLMRAAEVAPE